MTLDVTIIPAAISSTSLLQIDESLREQISTLFNEQMLKIELKMGKFITI